MNIDNKNEIVGRVAAGGDGTVKTRFDSMGSILLDMYFMGIDARAYRVSSIVSDMGDLGYGDWARVPKGVQARLIYDNYKFEC